METLDPQPPPQPPPPPPPPPAPQEQPAVAIQMMTQVILQRGDTYTYGQNSATIICQFCNTTVVTCVVYKPGLFTWALCLGLCIVGLWPCCWIPCCIDECKTAEHRCPKCGYVVGRYSVFS